MTFAACSSDELVESYQGEEISFTTRVTTRATETKLENLESFYVYADAPNYNMFLDKVQATKKNQIKQFILYPIINIGHPVSSNSISGHTVRATLSLKRENLKSIQHLRHFQTSPPKRRERINKIL